MGRVRPLEVSRIREPLTKKEAVILFDRQRGDFCAEVDGETVLRAERAADLERDVAQALRAGVGLSWARVLVFERPRPPRFYARAVHREGLRVVASLAFARGEAATRVDGEQLFRAWPPEELDEDLPAGLVPKDERVVSVLDPGLSDVVVRPYSEGVYRAMCLCALTLARGVDALPAFKGPEDVRKAFDLRAFIAELNAKPKGED